MGQQRAMKRLAKLHIWLGWLVGVPILMWTITGLVMVAKPIEEVRGTICANMFQNAPCPPIRKLPCRCRLKIHVRYGR